MRLRTDIGSTILMPSGNRIVRPYEPANSLVKQFIQLLCAQMSAVATAALDTSNVSKNCTAHASNLGANAGATITTYGILLGTGTTPPAIDDYKLQTPVTANITHGIMTFAVENPSASTWRLSLARIFTNLTGAPLAVKEIALYLLGFAGGSTFHCADHSLYTVTVAVNASLTLTYRFTISI
jgi:hypothetical protein